MTLASPAGQWAARDLEAGGLGALLGRGLVRVDGWSVPDANHPAPALLDLPELEQHDRADPEEQEAADDHVPERLEVEVVQPVEEAVVDVQLGADHLQVLDGA